MLNSRRTDLTQIISIETKARARYSTFVLDQAATFCLEDIQEINESPRNTIYPYTFFIIKTTCQFESQQPTIFIETNLCKKHVSKSLCEIIRSFQLLLDVHKEHIRTSKAMLGPVSTQYCNAPTKLLQVEGFTKGVSSSLDKMVPAFIRVLTIWEESKPNFLSKSLAYFC